MSLGSGIYILPTHRWYLERRIYLADDVNISLAGLHWLGAEPRLASQQQPA